MKRLWGIVTVGFVVCWSLLGIGQAQAVTAAQCLKTYNTKIRPIAIYWDPRIRTQKNLITASKNALETYMRKIKTPPGPNRTQQNWITAKNKLISQQDQELRRREQIKANEESIAHEKLNLCMRSVK